MVLDPNIILSIGSGTNRTQLEGPIDVATRFQQLQRMKQQTAMGDMELQNAQEEQAQQRAMREVFARNTNPDGTVNRAGVLSDLGRVNPMARMKMEQTWSAQDSAALKQQIDLKEALAKLDENKRKQVAFEADHLGRVAARVRSLPEEQRPAAWDAGIDYLASQGIDASQYRGKYNPQTLEMIYGQAVSVADALKENKPQSDLGRLNADLQANRISREDYEVMKKKISTHGALVNVGFSQPFEVTDPETGKAKLVQQDKQGELREVKGYAPKGGDKPMTEAQAAAFGFGIRAREADAILGQIEGKGANVSGVLPRLAAAAPGGVGNYALSPELQQYDQAKRNFISAVLRKESGAAIAESEFRNEDKKYFPQPGDSPEVLQQKAESRRTAIAVLQEQAGRPLPEKVKDVAPAQPKGASKPKAPAKRLKPGDVEDGYVFNGGNPADPKNWKKV